MLLYIYDYKTYNDKETATYKNDIPYSVYHSVHTEKYTNNKWKHNNWDYSISKFCLSSSQWVDDWMSD